MLLLSGTGRQIYTTLCANLLSVSYGTSLGWASSGLPFLQSNETVLPTGPLSKNGMYIQKLLILTNVVHDNAKW